MQKLEHYKKVLTEEYRKIVKDLASHGKIIDDNGDWEANPGIYDEDEEDYTVQADRMEQFNINVGAITILEKRLEEVRDALKRIEKGTYGKCGDHDIETERLDANPSATTCSVHMNNKRNSM